MLVGFGRGGFGLLGIGPRLGLRLGVRSYSRPLPRLGMRWLLAGVGMGLLLVVVWGRSLEHRNGFDECK